MDGTPTDERSASTMSQASSPVEARGEFPSFLNNSVGLDHVLINAKCMGGNLVLSDGCLKKVHGKDSLDSSRLLSHISDMAQFLSEQGKFWMIFSMSIFLKFPFSILHKGKKFSLLYECLIGKETSESTSGGKLYFHLHKM